MSASGVQDSETRGDRPRVDGRSERRRRGRRAVVDAVIELISELGRPPSADEVAARAGVSAATLFRYFPSLDDMRTEAIGRFAEQRSHLFDVPDIGQGELPARIATLVAARLAVYDAIAPVARFARARAAEQPLLADVIVGRRHQMADQVATHFATELAGRGDPERDDLVATIAAITSFESWDLSVSTGRGDVDIARAWTAAMTTLLA